MPITTGQGTLSYNGITFGPFHSSKITSKPKKDEAGRAVTYVEHTIDVEAYVYAVPGSVDLAIENDMIALRRALVAPAGVLRYEDKGFGDLTVNVAGQQWDADWGPWPTLYDYTPVGSNKAAFVVWEVVVKIPECKQAKFFERIAAFNFDKTYSIDTDGYTSVGTTGYIEIPITRNAVGDRNVPDNADRYRERLEELTPLGFRRQDRVFKLDKSRRRLDFSWVDVQLPVPLPEGVSQADATLTLESSLDRGFRVWNGTINGTLTAPAGSNKRLLYDKFVRIVGANLAEARQRVRQAARKNGAVLVTSIRMSDAMFGRTSTFDVGFKILGADLQSVLDNSGLWKPIEGTSFAKWRTSMEVPFSVRGQAGLAFDNKADVIVDLCRENRVPLGNGGKLINRAEKVPQAAQLIPGLAPENSWVGFKNKIKLLDNQSTARHRPLGRRLRTKSPQAPDATKDFKTTKGASITSISPTSGEPDIVQNVSTPEYTVVMEGMAVRLGYQVPTPELISVGGIEAVRKDGEVDTSYTVGSTGDLPLYVSTWRITYDLPLPPDRPVVTMANPLLDTGGTSADLTTGGSTTLRA